MISKIILNIFLKVNCPQKISKNTEIHMIKTIHINNIHI